jgi:hypothetical protein
MWHLRCEEKTSQTGRSAFGDEAKQVWLRSQVLECPSSRNPKLLYKVTVYGTDADCTCPGSSAGAHASTC